MKQLSQRRGQRFNLAISGLGVPAHVLTIPECVARSSPFGPRVGGSFWGGLGWQHEASDSCEIGQKRDMLKREG